MNPRNTSPTATFDAVGRRLRQPEVGTITGIKRSSMYMLIKRGLFPRGRPLWPGSHVVGWDLREVQAFMEGTWASTASAATSEKADKPEGTDSSAKVSQVSTKGELRDVDHDARESVASPVAPSAVRADSSAATPSKFRTRASAA